MENIQETLIQVTDVKKAFRQNVVLDQVNLTFESGCSYGLLGKNGAGKSTLINIMAGLSLPTSGSAMVLGSPAHQLEHAQKKQLGILTEKLPLLDELTGWEQLWLVGLLYGLEKDLMKTRIESLFDYFFDDRDAMKKRTATYSTGMKKKLGLMSALLNNPRILLLDEPFSGIDPVSATRMISFFKAWVNPKRMLLISSHNLDQIEKLVSHVIVINGQHVVYADTASTFTGQGLEKMETKLYDMLQGNERTLDDVNWLLEG